MISLLSGNSRILLTVDERGSWNELYYPHPGLHQQLQRSRLGLFDEDSKTFCWTDEGGEPPTEMSYIDGSDAARTRMTRLGLEVTMDDMVHPDMDIVIRRITLTNPSTRSRRMRIFQYQCLNIGGTLYQDTAYWDKERKTVNHYKGNYYFQLWGRPDFDHWTCGEHTLKGLEGTYVDAEDGELLGNDISHGAADSVVQWNVPLEAGESRTVHMFVMLGHSRKEVNDLFDNLQGRDPSLYTAETIEYCNHWAENKKLPLAADLSAKVHDVYRRSLFVMRDCQSHEGSIIASPDSRTLKSGGDTYNYCWWRDGGLIARAMSEVGLHQGVMNFLRFAARCQEEQGHFVHRHFPDGCVGSTWHPPPFLQVDQTASVISAADYQYQCSGNLDELLGTWDMVRRGADFLMEFVDEDGMPLPSFDLWEERKTVNAYSVGTVVQGLRSASRIGRALAKRSDYWADAAERMQRAALQQMWNPDRNALFKSVRPVDDTLDASTLISGLLPPTDPRFDQMVHSLEERLWNPDVGGLARYENDTYYGHENPWIICTLWLANAHLQMGRRERCRELIEWVTDTISPTDLLAEQIDPRSNEHTSVTPLVWSHSTFIEVVNAYSRSARKEPTAVASQAATVTTPRPRERRS